MTRGYRQLTLALLLAAGAAASAQNTVTDLEKGFANPPEQAKPRTWWHWTNGNVTESGISKDLEWMQRVGIGGFQLVDVKAGGGQTVPDKIWYGTPEWYHAVRHAALEAKRLGLEMSIFSSPGWSEAGGPWVKPEQAMKKLVSSEITIEGSQPFNGTLPAPPTITGPVRDASLPLRPGASPPPQFYKDAAVIAYRTPADELPAASLHPTVTTSSGEVNSTALLDDSLNTAVMIHAPDEGKPAWLQFAFSRPYTARAFTLGSRHGIPAGKVLASDDGTSFRVIAEMPGPQGYHGAMVRTFAFPAVTARFFRVELDGAPLRPAAVIHGETTIPAAEYSISEAKFHSEAEVNRWEDKGAFGSLMDVYSVAPTPAATAAAEIDRATIVDLTSKFDSEGKLHWDVPPGRWTILRIGYSLTGAENRPSTEAGEGLEVDKLDPSDVRSYFHGYMDPIREHLGDLTGSTLGYMTMDSWEAGMQNWSPSLPAAFKRLRGYDMTPWLPVLAGKVVGSADQSDRFLWDFRRTLADLYAESFYGTMDAELSKLHMGVYAEASGVALEIPEDTLLNKSKVQIPMAEFWVHALHPESMYYVDVRGAASAAHVYGKPIVATESFTGGGYESPYTLKKIADYWFAQGVNRLVFHTSAQQPLDTPPGNTMVGTHINRNITWANLARPFMTFVARISWMLQQGRPVADIAYLLPEGAPSTMPFWGAGLRPMPPAGYDYDYLNTDVLLHHTHVDAEGNIALDSGMSYRLLALPPTTLMTPEVAGKLHELVAAGATILGPRPTRSPSLADYPAADDEVRALANQVWGDMDGITNVQHALGKGMAYWGVTLPEVLDRMHVAPDFQATGTLDSAPVWTHRHSAENDIYYLANQADAPIDLTARFRVSGREAEIWRPMDGTREAVSYDSRNGFTTVPLHLAEREAIFVVFPNRKAAPSRTVPTYTETTLATLSGPWELRLPPNFGAPPQIQLDQLTSWTNSTDPGVQYFSGTATYEKSFNVPDGWQRYTGSIYLDLSKVRDIAEVKLNGTPVGLVWAPPYRVDLSKALKPGVNRLEIQVTNEWTNRILGDSLLPRGKRILPQEAGTPPPRMFGMPKTPVESGLLGPVTVIRQQERSTRP